jgi:hypothetical protein
MFNRVDFDAAYANYLAGTETSCVPIPVIFENDRQVILAAINMRNARDLEKASDEFDV